MRRPYDSLKRVLDLALSLVALVVLSPALALVALLVLLDMGRPVLFTQDRPGRGGRIFRLYKFRTMRLTDERGSASTGSDVAAAATDGERLTRLGRVLRATSLDELPELFNIMRGDMSLVGPRPLLVEYLPLYSAKQARRHEVRPGLTGLAQVSGRNALDWETRFALDVRYVDERSFMLDCRILAQTVAAVFSQKGISAEGSATMPPFTG